MKRSILFLTVLFISGISYAQQFHVVVIKNKKKIKGIGCEDAMMLPAYFATSKEMYAHAKAAFDGDKSRNIAVYKVTNKEVGIIVEWKETSGNYTCTKIAVSRGKDQPSAMQAAKKTYGNKNGLKIIGFLNVPTNESNTLMENFIKTGF